MQNRQRKIISSIFIRSMEISKDRCWFLCRIYHTESSPMGGFVQNGAGQASRKAPIPAMMQLVCWPSDQKNSIQLDVRACKGCECHPRCGNRKNSATSMKHQSVQGWRESYRPIGITRQNFFSAVDTSNVPGIHLFFHATHSYTDNKKNKISYRFGNLPFCT